MTGKMVSQMEKGMVEEEEEEKFEDAPPSFEVGKGEWYYVGFHLSTAVAGPALLSLPYAMAELGWVAGLAALLSLYCLTLYTASLSASLHEWDGRRHVRYRDLVESILGEGVANYIVWPCQWAYLMGSNVSVFIQSGLSLQAINQIYYPGSTEITLSGFIFYVLILVVILAQLPTIHSLRLINGIAMISTYIYSFGSVALSIYQVETFPSCAITESPPGCIPQRIYGIQGAVTDRPWNVLTGLSIMVFIYGNTIIPEIQSTAKHPSVQTMYKAIGVLYTLLAFTYIPVAVVAYWAYGYGMVSSDQSNLPSYMAAIGSPYWPVVTINIVTVCSAVCGVQLCNVPVLEWSETWVYKNISGDGVWAWKRWLMRTLIRIAYNGSLAFVAAALPFLGDFLSLIGALAITPVDLVIPITMYLVVRRPGNRVFWANVFLAGLCIIVGITGVVASIRGIIESLGEDELFANLGLAST